MANEEQLMKAEQAYVDAQIRAEEQLTARQGAEEARRLAEAERAAEQRRVAMARVIDEIGVLFMQLGVAADSSLGMAIAGFQNLGNAALGVQDVLANLASGNLWGAIAAGIGVVNMAVSGLKSLWNSIFGKSEIEKINDTRDAFISAHGGWLNLQHEIARATDEDLLKQLFDADTVQEYEAAIKAIEDALARINDTKVDPIVIPIEYELPGGIPGYETPPGEIPELPAAARGAVILPFVPRAQQGYITPNRPGPQLIAAHSNELVAPVRALAREIGAAAAAAAGAGRGEGEAAIILDGEVLGRWFKRRNGAGLLPVTVR